MQKILKTYLRRLTNLTHRNKSLLLLNLPVRQFIDVHELDFLNGKPSFDIIEQLISRKNTISLFPAQDPRHEKLNRTSQQLRQIQRSAKFIEEESGAIDLYIGYPFVRGKFADGSAVRCPLLFFPVNLSLENNNWKLKMREELIEINKSFLLAYRFFNQVSISEDLVDFEEMSTESLVFRTQLYEMLKKTDLAINFNQDLIRTNELIPFDNFNKVRFNENHKDGELKLFPEAVLGIFPQSGSYLSPDYEQFINENEFEKLEDFFASKTQPKPHTGIREENTFLPFPVDASQEKAILLVKEGQSLVVQGPPGTGKSQLIANLMADYTARGKKVLLVCQKRAALDVVHQRLSHIGMQDFVGLVHDFRHDRKKLYEQLTNQIDKIEEYKKQNYNLDAVFLDREFLQQSRRIDKISAELEEFRKALFDNLACGLSVKELYLTSYPDSPSISLKKDYKYFHFSVNVNEFSRKIQYYENYAVRTEAENYLWKNRVSFHHFQQQDLNEILETIVFIPEYQQAFGKKIVFFLDKALTLQKAEKLLDERKNWLNFSESIKNEAQWQILLRFFDKNRNEKHDNKWFQQKEKQVLKCFSGKGIEQNVEKSDLKSVENLLKNALQVRDNFLNWQLYQLFNKEKKLLADILKQNYLTFEKHDLLDFLEKTQNSIRLEELLKEMQEVDTVLKPYESEYLQHWFENHRQALKTCKLAKKAANFQSNLPMVSGENYLGFQQKVHKLFSLLQEAEVMKKSWNKYLTTKQIDKILEEKIDVFRLKQVLTEDFDELIETDTLWHEMSSVEKQVLEKLWENRQKTHNQTLSQFFDNSLRLAWIDDLEEKNSILKAVSTQKMTQLETELQEAVQQKAKLSQHILLMRLREKTYQEIAFNRLRNPVTYRDLKHQTTKKRNIYAIRKLMAEFSEEIFRLVPCWLASPETVSAVIPLHEEEKLPFDLVIFDEASQCFAEKGLPAMFRGKQIVVTGDAKQLTPNDLYSIRFEEETDENPDLEVESLLDLASRYLPQVQLQGHYRSKSLDLIDFSNQYFYKNTLKLLPEYEAMNDYEPAIDFVQANGIWEANVNEIEAEKVVEIIAKLLQHQPDKEIGIVTFNFKQQWLIQQKLEEWAVNQVFTLPESLFVKNIENVQGDERDIILFSVGYAADKKGKVAVQFGSLNLQGGENRLNVAITRAKEKIIVVSSILPQQLHTENTAHEGPKLLKKYLEYAWQVAENQYKPKPQVMESLAGQSLLKNKLVLFNDALLPELPFADLTEKQDNRYVNLILTDDDLYFQNLSAKEAHVYLPLMLSQKKWRFQRFYSRQLWKDTKKIGEKLKKK
ncbi:MAG: DUF4011 domain-containing protein [Verrucomicrobia bacterium]|nr:DUF4011 domain-containing protein [Cytophagales bacterium]